MIQEIIALLIVAWAVWYTVYNTYLFFKKSNKGKVCACKSCPSNNLLKEIQKARKN
jgi:large-conductance mechanosensitive channel